MNIWRERIWALIRLQSQNCLVTCVLGNRVFNEISTEGFSSSCDWFQWVIVFWRFLQIFSNEARYLLETGQFFTEIFGGSNVWIALWIRLFCFGYLFIISLVECKLIVFSVEGCHRWKCWGFLVFPCRLFVCWWYTRLLLIHGISVLRIRDFFLFHD